MPEPFREERGRLGKGRTRVLGMIVSEPGEARERFELADDFEPTANVFARAPPPRFQSEHAMLVPEKEGADEEPEGFVLTRVEKADDRGQAANLLGRAAPVASREIVLEAAQHQRLESFSLDLFEHRAVPSKGPLARAHRCCDRFYFQ